MLLNLFQVCSVGFVGVRREPNRDEFQSQGTLESWERLILVVGDRIVMYQDQPFTLRIAEINMWLHKVNYLLIHFDENT